MSFPNPDNYARDCDCGTTGANTTPPPASLVAEVEVQNLLSSRATPADEGSGNIYAKYGAPDIEESQSYVAGNERGVGSVDLQQVRDTATQVASATASVIGGGRNNTASGDFYSTVSGGNTNVASGTASTVGGGGANIASGSGSIIGGGTSNISSGSRSIIGGGEGNESSNDNTTVSGGANNTASGNTSTVCGGGNNRASGSYSTVLGGYGALADRYGMIANASGFFAGGEGSAQAVSFVLRTVTTSDSPTNVFLDGTGGSNRLTIPSGKILACTVNVSGIKSDGSLGAHYIKKVMIKNVGGTTSLVGTVSTVGSDVEDAGASAWDVTITADNTNDALDIKVTGAVSTTIRWVAVVQGLEIAYGT
jgi:hypothetical protein